MLTGTTETRVPRTPAPVTSHRRTPVDPPNTSHASPQDMQHQVDPDPPLFPELLALDVRTFRDWTDDTRIRRGIRWYRDGRIRGIVEQSDGVDADFDDCATGKFAHGTVRVRLIDGTPDVDAVLGKPWELDKDCWW